MKSQADKQRTEREFNEGDSVFLKLQPYTQSSVASRTNQNLSFRFYGPFKIIQRIGKVAYKLDLPEDSRIHPVVHVSQLKKHVPATMTVSDDLSSVGVEPIKELQPHQVLQVRTILRGAHSVPQKLIQWTGLPEALATWEDDHTLLEKFPQFAASGQAGIQGRGSVMGCHSSSTSSGP
ncbi:uncharacterized protein [Miscanthus floridulus]|uniref:uncharacterized protein n=1 Tax=Miscanthus floridulus TaxID=154761 RepID=UPI003459C646